MSLRVPLSCLIFDFPLPPLLFPPLTLCSFLLLRAASSFPPPAPPLSPALPLSSALSLHVDTLEHWWTCRAAQDKGSRNKREGGGGGGRNFVYIFKGKGRELSNANAFILYLIENKEKIKYYDTKETLKAHIDVCIS